VKRVVYLSTSGTIAVSDDPEFMGTEESPSPDAIIASWPYYRSKRYAEQVALETDDIEIICLNPSLLLGPGDEPGGVSTHSVQVFLDQGVPVAPAGGISFVDVRDVVNAIEASLTCGTPGDRYLLAGGNMRFFEFYSRLARITGRDAPVMSMPSITRRALGWFPKWGRNNGISAGVGPVISRADMELASHFWYADSSKAASELGWTPRGPTETLEDTVSDILDKRERSFQMYR
jgi:dihydroflavonol-4-reductase